ncbi:MAG: hypothetical protein AVDCRST_MAG89-3065 [uncultured Gemmatimonadetes bacterium]|uniref:Uncharacterized protein n=1 Tax=uncultured Gemmatimonadota bacterium TaxID=203437 RepID=A0A6J4M4N1_9BACT|nr:MAG: hypothetical protein AVDCRST_MAG89-3065 [uncultured Gemmatimonadota bacterium]
MRAKVQKRRGFGAPRSCRLANGTDRAMCYHASLHTPVSPVSMPVIQPPTAAPLARHHARSGVEPIPPSGAARGR